MPHPSIAEQIDRISIAGIQTHRNLALFPLVAEGAAEPDYRLLDEALERGDARVTEVSEAGSVPELRFDNRGAEAVLLLDGEELVGAKQNRILNLTILVPGGQSVVIPVSCVEAGRWRHESSEFRSAGRAHFAEGRARKAATVSFLLQAEGAARSDQGAVWEEIDRKAERMQARSATGAAAALYDTHRAALDDYRDAFRAMENQVGALFAIGGEVLGLDLFDSPATLEQLLPKLVESYALDAIDAAVTAGPERKREQGGEEQSEGKGQANRGATAEYARALLEAVAAAPVEAFDAVGEGEDLRLRGEDLAGGALHARGRIVHLCAFRVRGRRAGRFASPRRRADDDVLL